MQRPRAGLRRFVSAAPSGVVVGLVVGLVGGALALSPLGHPLEEGVGLHWLFQLRGPVEPPPEVAVVSLDEPAAHFGDRVAARDLGGCPIRPGQIKAGDWPRCLQARLVDRLVEQGAATIVFDVAFDAPRTETGDAALAAAIARARRVVLLERLKVDRLREGAVTVESLSPPTGRLRQAAAATAPFPLPKVPARVDQFWAFRAAAGDTPTLPVAALQVTAATALPPFLNLLQRSGAISEGDPPTAAGDAAGAADLRRLMVAIRRAFLADPTLAERLAHALKEENAAAAAGSGGGLLERLVDVYSGSDSYYLNFYGPPGTIPTVSGLRLVARAGAAAPESGPELRGRVVFVGASQTQTPEQDDGFYTVFTREDGVDLSGVEIAASAFANLLAGDALRPLSWLSTLAILLALGGALGFLAVEVRGVRAAAAVAAVAAGYFAATYLAFEASDLWLPVGIPVLLQAPAAILLGLGVQYLGAKRRGDNVSRAIRYYVPGPVAEALARKAEPTSETELSYGICLATDAERFTTLSEDLEPQALAALMNEYFEAVSAPVLRHDGTVSEVVADSMMCMWMTSQRDADLRLHACAAAVELCREVDRFNEQHRRHHLPTRVGLHAGWIGMANIGGGGRYAYGPIGDVANTASRIEGLNKHLGTRLLASENVVADLDGLLMRRVGCFALKGKSKTLSVFEIRGFEAEASEAERELCVEFTRALEAFEGARWTEAVERFAAVHSLHPHDGSTRFYLERARRYVAAPPDPAAGTVIRMDIK